MGPRLPQRSKGESLLGAYGWPAGCAASCLGHQKFDRSCRIIMALMVGKYLEIKTEQSLRQVRDQLWKVHEAHLRDDRTGKVHILRTNTADWANTALGKLLDLEFTH